MKVLIVRIGAMGDVIHALPAVRVLRDAHPDWQIGWAIEPKWAALLTTGSAAVGGSAQMPLVDRIHEVPTSRWKGRALSRETLGDIVDLRAELRGQRYDLCVDLQGSIRSAVIGRLSGAGRLAGPEEPREMPARWLYTERIETHAAHVTAQGFELLGLSGASAKGALLPVDPAAESWCDALLAETASMFRGMVVIAPTAGWGAKQWPAKRFGELAARLTRLGYQVMVNAARADEPIARQVLEAAGEVPLGSIRVVASTIGELIALMRRASLAVGGDTGPVHLAAALNRPVLALFGPTDPRRNGPVAGTAQGQAGVRVLRHRTSVVDHRRHAEMEAGLGQIDVDEVFLAAQELLASTAGAAGAKGLEWGDSHD